MSRLVFTALALSILLCGCSRRETPVEIGNREQILHRNVAGEPQDLDPHITTGMPEFYVQMAIFEGLTAEKPGSSDPVPGTAERWTVSDDGLVYTFFIRPTAKWSNGDPVTAEDFVFSYHRALAPAMANPYAYMLYCLKNGEAFHKNEITDFSQVGVKALDEKTLEITLQSPTPYLLRLLKHHSWFPVHPPTILKFGKMDERNTKWTRPPNLVGNGPFVLTSWEPYKKLIAEKNTQYWDAETTRLNAIHFYTIEDQNAEENAFRTGQLHVTRETPLERIKYYKENHPELIRMDPIAVTYYYELNCSRPPLDDVRVRRALAMALDREKIVNYVCKAGETVAHALTPPNLGGYTARAKLAYDPEKARKLLAEAGYPNGKGFPKLEILYNTHKGHMQIAEVIQQIWQETLNIDIDIINMEWKTYISERKAHHFDVARAGWVADYSDPSTFLEIFITGGGNNDSVYSNEKYDALLRQAATELDNNRRLELYQQAEEILMRDVPVIPIYHYRSKELVHPAVKNWLPNPLERHPYKYVYLEAGQ